MYYGSYGASCNFPGILSCKCEYTFLAQDWANPTICDHIRHYPVIPRDGIVSEVYHARKWRQDVDPHTLSPMYDSGGCHFYIDELSRLKNGTFVIPVRWLEDEDRIVHADAYVVKFDLTSTIYQTGTFISLKIDYAIGYRDCGGQ